LPSGPFNSRPTGRGRKERVREKEGDGNIGELPPATRSSEALYYYGISNVETVTYAYN